MDYEVFEGLTSQNRKKTYLVFEKRHLNIDQAKRYFRCSFLHLKIVDGYVLNDELYIDYRPARSKLVSVVYYVW